MTISPDPPNLLPHHVASAVPSPFLLNTWKHHAGWLRGRIGEAVAGGPAGLDELAAELAVVGRRLMDLYVGRLSPWEIAEAVRPALAAAGATTADRFAAWADEADGFRVVTLPADGSHWVLRLGAGDRFAHLHPGRWSPETRRVQANALKTAVMAHALAGLTGSAVDVATVNAARGRYLGLEPVRRLDDGGLGAVLAALG
jgi:hypothetical protein